MKRLSLSVILLASAALPVLAQSPLTITSNSPLPNAGVGQLYSFTFQRSGGSPAAAYTWSVPPTAGPPLFPAWLTLNPTTGTISGTPSLSDVGTRTFTIRLTNVGFVDKSFSLTVFQPPTINTTSPLPPGTVGALYSQGISVSGGTTPYSFDLIPGPVSGNFPTWLSINSATGVLSGTPPFPGAFNFTVVVVDNADLRVTRNFDLVIAAAPLTLGPTTLPNGRQNTFYSSGVAGSGGVPPYTYSVSAGALPTGLSLNTSTGAITGTPTVANTFNFTITVRDSFTGGPAPVTASRAYTVTIAPPLTITTSSPLPNGTSGVFYTTTFTAANGPTPYNWTLLSGGTGLPAGLSLDPATGVLSGTTSSTGTFTFTVQVLDATDASDTGFFSLTIDPPPVTITTASPLTSGQVGVFYSTTLQATGGTPGYTFSLDSGTLPAGLSLAANGTLSGTPTAAGPSSFVVRAQDSGTPRLQTTKSFSIDIAPATLTIPSATLPAATRGTPYSQSLVATGGTPPLTWTLASGSSLPAGLTLTSAGVITGTPTVDTTVNFTVEVRDAGSPQQFASRAFILTVQTPALVIVTTTLPNGQVGTPYSQQIVAQGGTLPFIWAIIGGSLPAGLTLTSDGVITGTPTATGLSGFTAQVTDNTFSPRQVQSRDFTLRIDPATLTITTSSLPPAVQNAFYSQQLAASGGTGTLTWSLASGSSLPAGLTLSSTGLISGSPTTLTNSAPFTVEVRDSGTPTQQLASRQLDIQVVPAALTISTTGLPFGQVGAPYTFQFTATGGTTPLTWTLASGSALPSGLTLSAGGLISGTPTTPGSTTFTVEVRDSAVPAQVDTRQFSITIVPGALNITTTTLPNGQVSSTYSQQLAATGGTGTLTWSLATGSTLPPGLTLSSTGLISGTPTTITSSTFTVEVRDSASPTPEMATRQLTIQIVPATLIISTTALPDGQVAVPYSQQLAATGGQTPISWRLATGSALPAGLTLSGTGLISGTPTATGNSSFTIEALDSSSPQQIASRQFNLFIAPPGLVITTNTLPDAQVGTPYSQTVAASGGTPPYVWSLLPGTSLPAGLTLSAAGVVSGTPSTPGPSTFTLVVRDSALSTAAQTASRQFTIQVAPPTLTITTPTALPAGQVGAPYSSSLNATGGVLPHTWTLASGSSLPAGLTLTASGAITGTPTTVGNFTFTAEVRDSATAPQQMAGRQFTLQIVPPTLTILTSSPLPSGQVGVPYTLTFASLGGTPLVGWSVVSGALPAGLTLSPTGVLTGTPTTAATSSFTVRAIDSGAGGQMQQAERLFTLQVIPPTLTIITTSPLPNGQVGVPYTLTLASQGGTAPVAWTLVSGALPAGLTLSPTGLLSGTPTTVATSSFTVRASDSGAGGLAQQAERLFTLQVIPPTLTIITTSPLPNGQVGVPYTLTLASQGGTAPVAWTLVSGALPAGLTLSPTGLLSGTPTTVATSSFTVRASDSGAGGLAQQAERLFTLQVIPPTLTIITTSPLPNGQVGVPYTLTLASQGGTAPVAWTLVSGALPAGLTLSPTGLLSGTPTTVATSSFTVRASDSGAGGLAQQAERLFTLQVIPPTLVITTADPLPAGTAGVAYNLVLQASGGVPGYTWAAAGGTVPPGLTLAPNGTLSGVPTTNGPFQFLARVTDATGVSTSRQFSVAIGAAAPLLITTASPLPAAAQASAYAVRFTASGGVPPYRFTLDGGELPARMTLNPDGTLSGAPLGGDFNFRIRVTDFMNVSSTKDFQIHVEAPEPEFRITSGSLPEGFVTRYYGFNFSAAGGTPPYTWQSNGAMPPGLTLDSRGGISGDPTQVGTFSISVQVSDENGRRASGTFQLRINPQPLTITTTSVSDARVGDSYSGSIAAAGGAPPFAWSIATGSLPAGLSLSTTGGITGTPTEPGTFSFTVQVTDSANVRTTRAYSLRVLPPALTITTSSLGRGVVDSAYSSSVAASGGVPPYAFSVSGGSLPPGISMNELGALSGTPTEPGEFPVTIQVTDAVQSVSTRGFTISVSAPLRLVTQSPLAAMTVGAAASAGFSATGGVPPYQFSLSGGSPPPGLSFSGSTLSGTPTQAGTFSFNVTVTDARGQTASRDFSVTVSSGLTITTTAAPNGTAGSAYSLALTSVGGTGVSSWSLDGGSLPNGLSIDPAGSITGTPTQAGTFSFTVRASDQSTPAQTATRALSITIGLPQLSGLTVSGLPDNPQPRQQPPITVTIPNAFPTDLRGTVTLTFASDAVNNVDDPAVRFSAGGRTADFTIPAGRTDAAFAAGSTLAVQTGTVAGTITLTTTLTSGNTTVPCQCAPRVIRISRTAPTILTVQATRTPNGFNVVVTGFSTTREMTQGTFRFGGSTALQTPEVVVPLGPAFNTFYQNANSAQFGGNFILTQPFVLAGDSSAVNSVTVLLTNSVGQSQPVTINF